MFEIVGKDEIAPKFHRFVVRAPEIARKHRPGQFVMVLPGETGERIPLTISASDRDAGTITLVVQEVGRTTMAMAEYNVGDFFLAVVGPLGTPTHIERFGTVVCIGGGAGIAPLLPIAAGMREAGNRVLAILGGRTEDLVILHDEMIAASNEIFITTDDGSLGRHGLVTHQLADLIASGTPDLVVAIGPAVMMRAVAEQTRPLGIPTLASLNSIMVDGTGMCGACRITVGGQTKFVCVDGPEFDAHQVDFDLLIKRLRMYLPEEQAARQRHLELHQCRALAGDTRD